MFRDRAEAGRKLGALVVDLDLPDPVVLALPRGGVPVAAEVADALGVTFDVLVARKVGLPNRPELGIGAVAEGGGLVLDRAMATAFGVAPDVLERHVEAGRAEVARRVRRYRGERPLPAVAGRDVVVVDDGLATGVTAEAAARAVRALGPRRLVVAAPACALATLARLRDSADEVVCVTAPADFRAVGLWYRDFRQTTDEDVLRLLATRARHSDGGGRGPVRWRDTGTVRIHHLFADEDGVSHFEDIEVEWETEQGPSKRSAWLPVTGLLFRQTSGEYSLDWHSAPRRQYVVNLDAGVRITASDGEVREIGAGEVLLAEDLTGRGHLSEAISGAMRHSIFLALE